MKPDNLWPGHLQQRELDSFSAEAARFYAAAGHHVYAVIGGIIDLI